MRIFKKSLMTGASALLAAAAAGSPAFAQVNIHNGGSSLIAPYLTQAEFCYDANTSWFTLAQISDGMGHTFNDDSKPTPGCSVNGPGFGSLGINTTDTFQTLSSSSGNGIGTFLSGTPGVAVDTDSYPIDGVFPDTGTSWSTYTFGLSDSPLTAAQLTLYTSGGTDTWTQLNKSETVTVPAATNGPLIQIPVSVDPVALAYNADYATGKPFNIQTGDNRIHLDVSAYCGIFTGTITTWDNSTLSALNGGTSLTGTDTNVPITLVGRSDSSGTTNIFTRHMANVCGAGNPYIIGTGPQLGSQTLPGGVSFTTEQGSGGVASEIAAMPGAIGYIGPDFTHHFHTASGATSVDIFSARLINHNNTGAGAVEANGANATLAFEDAELPSDPTDQTQWVPTLSIADPSTGYPIIGTTNALLNTVYDADTVATLTTTYDSLSNTGGFLSWYYTDPTSGQILSNVGLAPLPDAWLAAINADFIDPNDPNNLGLTIHS